MRLTVLSENLALNGFNAEHGLSYLVEADNEKILFDTGQSDLFIRNAEKLGIDLDSNVNIVVLSHGHWDHGDGLKYLKHKTLITHPKAFSRRFGSSNKPSVGLSFSRQEIEDQYDIIETTKPYYITENILFLGEIPRLNDFESQSTPFNFEKGEPDFVADDSAIVVKQDQELIIITGCSHSGICNICEYARKVTGIQNISTVIGGLHLKYLNQQTQKTIGYFQQNEVKNVFPSHCTRFSIIDVFEQHFNSKRIKAGMTLKL